MIDWPDFRELHRALDGLEDAEPPEEWLISIVCEAFNCVPSTAMRELAELPWPLLFDILDLRAYAKAKEELEAFRPGKGKKAPAGPYIDAVAKVQDAVMREERDRKLARLDRGA